MTLEHKPVPKHTHEIHHPKGDFIGPNSVYLENWKRYIRSLKNDTSNSETKNKDAGQSDHTGEEGVHNKD